MGFITKSMKVNHTNQITDGIITGAKLASSGIITSATQINDGIVTGTKLANDTITAEKIGVLDYVRALQYDVYNDAKTAIKARIDHDEATSYARFLSGADVATLDSVFYIETHIMPKGFVFGPKVDVVFCGNKRLAEVGAPSFQGDALRFGQAEITNNEISPTANIARSKIAGSDIQLGTGALSQNQLEGEYDIVAPITPLLYPALAILTVDIDTTNYNIGITYAKITDGFNVTLASEQIVQSGVTGTVSTKYGKTTTVMARISSGSVKGRISLGQQGGGTFTAVMVVLSA